MVIFATGTLEDLDAVGIKQEELGGECFGCNAIRSFWSTYAGGNFCSKYMGDHFCCNYADGSSSCMQLGGIFSSRYIYAPDCFYSIAIYAVSSNFLFLTDSLFS